MKLYNRQLKNLEDLRREKHMLQYAVRHTGDWLSFRELERAAKKPNGGQTTGAGLIATILSVAGSKSILHTIITLAPSLFTLIKKRSSGGRKRPNPLGKLATEVIGGYMKWKAIELLYKGIRTMKNSGKTKDLK